MPLSERNVKVSAKPVHQVARACLYFYFFSTRVMFPFICQWDDGFFLFVFFVFFLFVHGTQNTVCHSHCHCNLYELHWTRRKLVNEVSALSPPSENNGVWRNTSMNIVNCHTQKKQLWVFIYTANTSGMLYTFTEFGCNGKPTVLTV